MASRQKPNGREEAALVFVREKLREDGQSIPLIASKTGVSTRWLFACKAGDILNPTIQNLSAVAAYYGFKIVATPV
jgi:hypothetical protein